MNVVKMDSHWKQYQHENVLPWNNT